MPVSAGLERMWIISSSKRLFCFCKDIFDRPAMQIKRTDEHKYADNEQEDRVEDDPGNNSRDHDICMCQKRNPKYERVNSSLMESRTFVEDDPEGGE